MTDFNQNITRKFDLNRNKLKLKIDFDSSLTCYNLDPKSIFLYLSSQNKNANESLYHPTLKNKTGSRLRNFPKGTFLYYVMRLGGGCLN